MKNDEQYDVMIGGKERRVLEEENKSVNNNSTLILAAEQTHRRDPLEHFNYYTGGWDYRNSHYWAVSLFLQFFYLYLYFFFLKKIHSIFIVQ